MIKAAATYNCNVLEPLFPDDALTMSVPLAGNLSLVAGTILGQVSSANANEVQTLDFGGTVSGGTFTVTVYDPEGNGYTSAALDYNITNANLKIALDALLVTAGYIGGTVTIGGGACPTDATVTFGGNCAATPMPLMVAGAGSLTGTNPTLTITRTTTGIKKGVYAAYNDSLSDGTQVAKLILMMDVKTDCLGKVVFGTQSTSEHGNKSNTAPAFYQGVFSVGDLTGLDANGVADFGRLLSGAVTESTAILSVR